LAQCEKGVYQMQERNKRSATAKRLRAAVSVLMIGSVVAVPAVAAPNALSRAAEKRAQVQAEADAKATADKAAEEAKAAAQQKAQDALAFNPFAPSAKPPAPPVPPKQTPAQQEAFRRLEERIRLLAAQRSGAARIHLVRLAEMVAARRSPNTPPSYTDPRPSDPPRPGDNVAPGPQ